MKLKGQGRMLVAEAASLQVCTFAFHPGTAGRLPIAIATIQLTALHLLMMMAHGQPDINAPCGHVTVQARALATQHLILEQAIEHRN